MLKVFPIDFVRQVIEQTLAFQHYQSDGKFFGGKNQVNLMSFYEQLQKEDEVNRFVEIYKDLTEQQNRTGLIMNGTIIAPENPTITNLNKGLIIPMAFTCSFRVKLEDRDMALETINNMIDILKGRKQDVAMFSNGQLLMVGTIANNVDEIPSTHEGDFLGEYDDDFSINAYMTETIIPSLEAKGINVRKVNNTCYYLEDIASGQLIIVQKDQTDGWVRVFEETRGLDLPPELTFEKYKLSMSFDSLRCDEPRNLNGSEYCTISFGGSATLVSKDILLGNELTKFGIKNYKLMGKIPTTFEDNYQWLEPLELPSGNAANTISNNLLSNNFISNSHTDGLAISLQYTFILDKSVDFLRNAFLYGRYGKQGTALQNYKDGLTPNMIYKITEIWSSWGEVDVLEYNGKIIESIDIENTESDTLTITIPIQLQGANN